MGSAVTRLGRSPSDAYRLRPVPLTWAAGSVSAAARELLAKSRFVSRAEPPTLIRRAAALAAVFFTGWLFLACVSPSFGPWHWPGLHAWLSRHVILAVFGVTMGWMGVYWLALEIGCWAANTLLLIGQSMCFPVRLLVRSARRLVGCRLVLDGSRRVLGRWLAPDEVIAACGKILPGLSTADAIGWNRLTPGQTISRWLELQGGEAIKALPDRVWPELVTPDLSPLAMAHLFRHCLRGDGSAARPVSAALIAQNWFAQPARAPLLVRELVVLPADQLAAALDMLSELSRPQRGLTTRCVIEGVQKLGDAGALRRVQSAIALLSAETCEAAVARG
jgi:hypothetical protein